jgi:hypothetical protein
MRFTVRATEKYYEAKWWLEDSANRVFRFELDENTVAAWRLAIRKLPGNLIPDKQSFLDCQFCYDFSNPEDRAEAILERVAFCKFLLALGRERGTNFPALEIIRNHSEIIGLAHQFPYSLLFLDNETLDDELNDEEESNKWKLVLEEKYQKPQSNSSDVSWVADLVRHYDVLRELTYLKKRSAQKDQQLELIGREYGARVKGILGFLDSAIQHSRTSFTDSNTLKASSDIRRLSVKYSPCLHGLLVENETLDLNERREHLDLILAQRMKDSDRDVLLRDILVDLQEDAQEYPENSDAMQTIASLMAQYYLRRYDLDRAISIWSEVNRFSKDKILSMLLLFYRFQPPSIMIFLGTLTALSFISVTAGWVAYAVLFLSFLILGFGLLAIAERFFKKRGFSYMELFLPRLLGSIVVGLSILALESTVWEITLDMSWGNWIVTILASYLGSLAYLFLDVHKNTRLLPDGLDSSLGTGEKKARFTLMGRSIQTTFRIFAIGLLEAFVSTTIVSALIPFNALGETFQSWIEKGTTLILSDGMVLKVLQENGVPVYAFILQLFGKNGLTLTYFPKLIVLWTGLSLLIGAFAQLLWQDDQITAS